MTFVLYDVRKSRDSSLNQVGLVAFLPRWNGRSHYSIFDTFISTCSAFFKAWESSF